MTRPYYINTTVQYALIFTTVKNDNFTAVKITIFIPPVYEVYRRYIVFAFSVPMFVCLCV